MSARNHPTFVVSARVAEAPGVATALGRFARGVSVDGDAIPVAADGYVFMAGEGPPEHWWRSGVVLMAGVDGSEAEHRLALRVGASAVVHRGMTREDLAAVWAAVVAGFYPLPRTIAPLVAGRIERRPDGLVLSERDKAILAGLSRGETMAAVADRLGCSERHARRHARSLWDTLGVANRAQGLVAAARWGVLE